MVPRRDALRRLGAAAAAALVLTSWTALRWARREQAAIATLEAVPAAPATGNELRRSEQRYRGYFEHLPECLFVVAVTAEGGFRFEAYNPASGEGHRAVEC